MGLDITVIGYKGVVGNATYELFNSLGYKVSGVDVGDRPVSSDVTFVCLPEAKVTPNILRQHTTRLFVIRSTVPPGTCEALQLELGVHVAHNPEFLREASAVLDEFNPERVVIGQCCRKHGGLLKHLYRPLRRPIHVTNTRASELLKLACNGYLATLISYWNEIEEIASALGINGVEVGMLASTDPRINPYGSRYHHRFGGRCLPKDTIALITVARRCGVNPSMLEATLKINEECK